MLFTQNGFILLIEFNLKGYHHRDDFNVFNDNNTMHVFWLFKVTQQIDEVAPLITETCGHSQS